MMLGNISGALLTLVFAAVAAAGVLAAARLHRVARRPEAAGPAGAAPAPSAGPLGEAASA